MSAPTAENQRYQNLSSVRDSIKHNNNNNDNNNYKSNNS